MIATRTILRSMLAGTAVLASFAMTAGARAQSAGCPVTYAQLKATLTAADNDDSSGFGNHYWGVVVNRAGLVCAVAYSGPNVGSQWLLSRQIAAAKAFTANGLSLNIGTGSGSLSTALLYSFAVPGSNNNVNPLYGVADGNPVDGTLAFAGNYANFGTANDPLIGTRVGGTITFGGGLALYSGTTVVGGLGLSGDTACADHSTAWRTRIKLNLQQANPADQLPFSSTGAGMPNGHPHCPNDGATIGAR